MKALCLPSLKLNHTKQRQSVLNTFLKIPLPKHNYFHDNILHSNPYLYTDTHTYIHSHM